MSLLPPKRALAILHLEDSAADRELVRELFQAEGLVCEFRAVESRTAFEAALEQGQFDLILSDYSLPGFDGMTALALAQQRRPEIPFVFISGVMGEERAIETLKNGATDYVLKQRINRIVPCVRRALREVVDRQQLSETEVRLHQSEAQMRQIMEHVGDWILVFDPQGNCSYSNPAYAKALDASPGTAGHDFWDRLEGDDAVRLREDFNTVVRHGQTHRSEARVRNGQAHRHIEAQFNPGCDQRGTLINVILVCRDITARRLAEEQMRAQTAIMDQAQDAIIICGPEDEIIYWNRSAERIYGWTAAEARGRNLNTFLHPAPPPQLAEARKSVLVLGNWHGELRQAAKDGSTVEVRSRWTLFRDAAGKPQSLLVVNSDVRSQLRDEGEFKRAQHVASLEVLADTLARDMQIMVEPLLLSSQLLRLRGRNQDAPDLYSPRLAELIRQTDLLAQSTAVVRVPLPLSSLVEEVARLLRMSFPANVAVTTSIPADLWTVTGDPDAVRQVLLNLSINAREAMPEGGILELNAENLALSGDDGRLRGVGRPGLHVVITLSDTGKGIPSQDLSRIFSPFFRHQEQGHAVGTGLTAVRAIVQSHGGFVTVESELNQGSRFRVFLPATTQAAVVEVRPPRRVLPHGHGECILLVDDEAGFREITQVTLEKYGYRVLTASDGSEGLALFMRHRDEIKLVLTDIVMPVMDGAALIGALNKLEVRIPFLAVSGLVEREKVMVSTAAPGVSVEFLAKPFSPEALLTLVRELLQRSAAARA
ncbi:MAG: hypothetical protein B9S33_04095 [Pedosphaera sp. Tous-C6FEB]|nr:MAG: hypothetical protein B9S33_04095 [Pedosphaera sp. Tous-C6FEB]